MGEKEKGRKQGVEKRTKREEKETGVGRIDEEQRDPLEVRDLVASG